MKRCYLHIGIHKTGTTSIQGALNQNGSLFRSHGIRYLEAGRRNGNHKPLCEAIRSPNGDQTVPEPWPSAVTEVASGQEGTVIISSEVFDGFKNKDVLRLKETLQNMENFVDFEIVAYIRPQANLFVSQHNQQVKVGYRRESLEEFVAQRLENPPHWASFRRLLEPWLRVFGCDHIDVRVAEQRFLHNGSVCADFLHLIGGAHVIGQLQSPFWRNAALSAAVLEGIRDVLKMDEVWRLPFETRRELLRGFIKSYLNQTNETVGAANANRIFERPALHAETLQECRQIFAEDNAWVARHFFGGHDKIDVCYEDQIQSADRRWGWDEEKDGLLRKWVRGSLMEHIQSSGYCS